MGLAYNSLLVAPIVLPLLFALFTLLGKGQARRLGHLASLLTVGAVALLLWQGATTGRLSSQLGDWPPPLGISLAADGLALVMLCMTGITGLAISVYAGGYFQSRIATGKGFRHYQQEQSFWPLWLLLWGALNALFLSADIFNIYVTLELVALASVGLTALSGKPPSQVAALRYLLVSVVGSLSFLLGVALLYRGAGRLDLLGLQATVVWSPSQLMALVLISLGLLLKGALFPFHFWLPQAHANALAPVSAILSGLVIKAAWYLLFRLWQGMAIMLLGQSGAFLFAILGICAIAWGAWQALLQQRLKMLVAYSTVAQIGYFFIVWPLLEKGGGQAVCYYVISHSCAKAAMFLAAGTFFLHVGHDRIRDLVGIRQLLPLSSFAFAISGLSLMGLPPSGGFVAKYLYLRLAFMAQSWWLVAAVLLGSCLAALYVYRAVSRILSPSMGVVERHVAVAARMEWSALALAGCALLLGFLAPLPLAVLEVAG